MLREQRQLGDKKRRNPKELRANQHIVPSAKTSQVFAGVRLGFNEWPSRQKGLGICEMKKRP